jgi:hypothetical protein
MLCFCSSLLLLVCFCSAPHSVLSVLTPLSAASLALLLPLAPRTSLLLPLEKHSLVRCLLRCLLGCLLLCLFAVSLALLTPRSAYLSLSVCMLPYHTHTHTGRAGGVGCADRLHTLHRRLSQPQHAPVAKGRVVLCGPAGLVGQRLHALVQSGLVRASACFRTAAKGRVVLCGPAGLVRASACVSSVVYTLLCGPAGAVYTPRLKHQVRHKKKKSNEGKRLRLNYGMQSL